MKTIALEEPKVTIVIAVLNNGAGLEAILDSTKQQTYSNWELVIIDGGSTDGTRDILVNRSGEIHFWASEPDRGIYSAWNKALTQVTGEYVCFIGADDRWAHPQALRHLVALTQDKPDIVCAKFAVDPPGRIRKAEIGEPWSWNSIARGMDLSHRGMLHHVSLFERHGEFDESFRIAGDYEYLLRCGKDLKAEFADEVTVVASAEGISFKQRYRSYGERLIAQRKHRSVSRVHAYWLLLRDYLKLLIQDILRRGRRAGEVNLPS